MRYHFSSHDAHNIFFLVIMLFSPSSYNNNNSNVATNNIQADAVRTLKQ